MKASDLFIKCLEEENVEYIFGVPGEENLDILESLRKSTIKLITVRHEQAAAFMASAYGRLTGRAGVVLTTLGPGATNLLTGLAFATMGGIPLVALTGQKAIKISKQGMFQKIDILSIMQPITKSSRRIEKSEKIPVLIRRAFRAALSERPGAVLLELPEDIAKEETSVKVSKKTLTHIPCPAKEIIEIAKTHIEKAKSPVIVIGGDAARAQILEPLSEFMKKTRIPFTTTQMGKGVVDEESPQYLGTTALSKNDYLHFALERSDLIITIGHTIREKPPFLHGKNTQTLIHINFVEAEISQIYEPDVEIIGDIAVTLRELTDLITPSRDWDFSYFHKVHERLQEKINEQEKGSSFPVKPQHFVACLKKTAPKNSIISLDNGMYKIWLTRNFPANHRHHLLLDNVLASMGAGLPSAIAAQLVYPDRKVLAICGDGGFMMNSQELETAKRLALPLKIIILNDNGFGMIKWKQRDLNFPDFGLDFDNPDFALYAKSYGISGFTLEKSDNLEEKLRFFLDLKELALLEIPIDYSENYKVLIDELKKITIT